MDLMSNISSPTQQTKSVSAPTAAVMRCLHGLGLLVKHFDIEKYAKESVGSCLSHEMIMLILKNHITMMFGWHHLM